MKQPPGQIPFNRPLIVGRELDYIRQAVEAMHTSGDGPFTQRVARLLRDALGVERAMLTPSCTDALEMAGLLLDLGPGDEFVVPSFAFVSTVNAFVLRGARPVFADIRPDTLNLDESQLEATITPLTRLVVPLHYAGVACEMDAITSIANAHGLSVVEDNAHGLFGSYRGKPLGSFGGLAALSFHETKNFSCGEGGALLLNEPGFVERAEFIRDKGTDRQRLFRGQVDKYTWVDVGSSFVLSDLLAAFLYGQLEQRERVLAERERIWRGYDGALRGAIERHGVSLPVVPPHCRQGFHMYYLLLPGLAVRQRLVAHLARRGIASVFHYTPLHLSRMGRRFGGRPGQCPVTERISETLLRLPFHLELTDDDQRRVVQSIFEFFGE
ncbi:MAG TPA: dTDP-4-amino-4,6-dideoxygalactose transaminase [Candidatus Polarisedimenticolaceae bacterium]|nr:dTDP-4-amino-4,6-dideoxygalactose transaminase [Candidatus Polarisedimenticolaceae bacterium]